MTHNLTLYITPNLDYQTREIKTMDNTILKTQGISTIDFHVLVGNKDIQIKLNNIYYLSKLDINMILYRILNEKRCEFRAMNGFL